MGSMCAIEQRHVLPYICFESKYKQQNAIKQSSAIVVEFDYFKGKPFWYNVSHRFAHCSHCSDGVKTNTEINYLWLDYCSLNNRLKSNRKLC